MEHTPTPWIICGDGNPIRNVNDPIFYKLGIRKGGIRIAEAVGIGEENAKANAARIVHCVNNFDEVLGALKSALYIIEELTQDTLTEDSEYKEQFVSIHQAIDKAEGK